jgi:aryl-alcohol dehydrogenase-like predicted oxidoreductase
MSAQITLPNTDLSVYPLCLGGNVFGWTANEDESFIVLDEHRALGGNFIDTADAYSAWVPGNSGGESETIIGNWMASRGTRSETVVATKVAKLSTRPGLGRSNIIAACDDSLRRLQTDYIDLYYAHEDDQNTPLEETLGAFDELQKAGKIRFAAASNYSADRMKQALEVSQNNGLIKYVALQNLYNLVEREEFERDSVPFLAESGISALPFFSLAMGFLTGKYQPGVEVSSGRAGGVEQYKNDRGWAVVRTLGEIAGDLKTTDSAVALAWLRANPVVATPIASARTVEQLRGIMPVVELSADQVARLTTASAV